VSGADDGHAAHGGPGTGTPRGPYRTGVRRRAELIESATSVFARYGYEGGSLRQIAEGIGVTPAALFRYFDSKEELLIAVLEHWDEDTGDRIPETARGLEYFERLPDLIAHHARNRGLVELFLTVGTEASNPAHPARAFMVARYERIVAEAAAHLREAVDAGAAAPMTDAQIDAQVRGVIAIMDGIQLQWLLEPDIDAESIFREHVGRVIAGWASDAAG
jgi:AcrR family transcriptional regulator